MRRTRRYLSALALMALLSGPAAASEATYTTGGDMLKFCRAKAATWQWGVCAGTAIGASATIEALQLADVIPRMLCLPDRVTNLQLRDAYWHYLERNPDTHSEMAAGLAGLALLDAFPCAQQRPSSTPADRPALRF